MKTGVIIQARNSSSRLPGKVLKELPYSSGITVLQHVIRRACKANSVDQVIVATTNNACDNTIIEIVQKEQVQFFRGSENDVLARYYFAAKQFKLDFIIRILSDCPCIDWNVIDRIVNELTDKGYDLLHTTQSYPRGTGDIEVMTFDSLESAYMNATTKHEREHVCPYIYDTHPEMFKTSKIEAEEEYCRPDIRITLDTQSDYTALCAVFDFLYEKNKFFTIQHIIDLYTEKPWLQMINSHTRQKISSDLNGEIAEALKLLELQDLKKAKKFLTENWTPKNSSYK